MAKQVWSCDVCKSAFETEAACMVHEVECLKAREQAQEIADAVSNLVRLVDRSGAVRVHTNATILCESVECIYDVVSRELTIQEKR